MNASVIVLSKYLPDLIRVSFSGVLAFLLYWSLRHRGLD